MTCFRHRASSGFTLVELMTVIAIIAILAGIVVGVAGYATAKADKSRAIADMEKIKNALEEYRIEFGRYVSQGVGAGSSNMTLNPVFSNSLSVYKKDLNFTDPWGNPYYYTAQSNGLRMYKLWSLGPDKLDAADDLDSAQSGQ